VTQPARHRTRLFRVRRGKPGQAPGTLQADPAASVPRVRAIAYDVQTCEELDSVDPARLPELRGDGRRLWVNVDGLGQGQMIEQIGAAFGLHPLSLEDVVNVHQRPKVEEYEGSLFIVCRMITPGDGITTEQISFFLGSDFLVTFQERGGDCFDPVRKRLRTAKGRIRHTNVDYLCYALLDTIIDEHFPIVERLGNELEDLEDETIENSQPDTLTRIHDLKRDLIVLRREIWPEREMVNRLLKDESGLIHDGTRVYLRDTYDHTVQLIDMMENYRELASGLMDLYLSTVSYQMNEVMKVLTIIATIFIPLSFVAGVYGMNFDTKQPLNMPELSWRYGYVIVLACMLLVALGMLVYFWRKGWIGRR